MGLYQVSFTDKELGKGERKLWRRRFVVAADTPAEATALVTHLYPYYATGYSTTHVDPIPDGIFHVAPDRVFPSEAE